MDKEFIIAIDGPAGSGKSAFARKTSERLDFLHLDSGAFYRAVAWYLFQQNVTPEQDFLFSSALEHIQLSLENGQLFLNGQEVGQSIRTERISRLTSAFSVFPVIRDFVNQKVRAACVGKPVVVEGRDIGTVVFPDADLKFFLTAPVAVRAKRRYEQLLSQGESPQEEQILREMKKRDRQDSMRQTAPLKKAEDAIELDSSLLSLEEEVEQVVRLVAEKKGASSCR
ncbi:MAG TPA: (d)CMP kinase [Thermotogota bacterium]|nr:(d)CMP kinase [Thermotogota bacterium]HRW91724.1 (d)CMP kinase [Thermotogota bacterium]